jgi:hypothetical protein
MRDGETGAGVRKGEQPIVSPRNSDTTISSPVNAEEQYRPRGAPAQPEASEKTDADWIVKWGGDDPDNPLNTPVLKKWYVPLIITAPD